jgi:hypothetical protein
MSQRKNPRGHRHRSRPTEGNRIRVRGKRLDQIDNTKLSLAYWLLAKQLVEDKTDPRQLTEDEVRKVAETIDDHGTPKPPTEKRS